MVFTNGLKMGFDKIAKIKKIYEDSVKELDSAIDYIDQHVSKNNEIIIRLNSENNIADAKKQEALQLRAKLAEFC